MKANLLKKLLVGSLATVMAVGMLSGCSSSSSSSSDDSSSNAASESEAEEDEEADEAEDTSSDVDYSVVGDITFIMSSRDTFLSTLEEAAQEAGEKYGISVITQDANYDSSKVIQYVEAAATAGQKAVIVNMVDPETAPEIVEAAGDMYVVFVNRVPSDESVLSDKVVYVGSDDRDSGRYQGEYLAEYFKSIGKTEISYILLKGTLGQTSTNYRSESVLQALEDNGITATEATAPLAADFNRATAQDMISPLLTTIEYDCIISNNDEMALGAVEAMLAAGLDPSSVPIVGIDATIDGCEGVKEGYLAMTVFQNAEGQGTSALLAAVNLVLGNPINEGIDIEPDETGHILWVPYEPVTIDNVDDYS